MFPNATLCAHASVYHVANAQPHDGLFGWVSDANNMCVSRSIRSKLFAMRARDLLWSALSWAPEGSTCPRYQASSRRTGHWAAMMIIASAMPLRPSCSVVKLRPCPFCARRHSMPIKRSIPIVQMRVSGLDSAACWLWESATRLNSPCCQGKCFPNLGLGDCRVLRKLI